jgi:hypothetical protein
MRYWRLVGTLVLATAALAALAAEASAQRHGGRGPGYRPRAVFYGGYWGPGWGFYHPYYAWWGYPYPYAPPTGDRVGVRLEVQPAETEVYVDGYYAGKVEEFDGFFQRLNVAPGQHVVELYLDGHEIAREKLYASSGTSYKVRHEMRPLAAGEPPPPRPRPREPEPAALASADRPPMEPRQPAAPAPGFGVLVVRTQPDRAEIWIDGEPWPGDRGEELQVHLPAGRHRVEVRGPGHRSFSTEIEIEAGQAVPLNVKLPPSE